MADRTLSGALAAALLCWPAGADEYRLIDAICEETRETAVLTPRSRRPSDYDPPIPAQPTI